MADDDDPPRKFYEFKPRDFERVNGPRPGSQPLSPLAPLETPDEKIEVRDFYRQAATPGPVLRGESTVVKNEVHAILQDNVARANAAGLNDLAPKPKRRSRRTRDFFLVIIPLNAFFAYAAFGPYSSVVMLAYGIAGMIMTTIGLTWVMFFVMDKY